MTDFISDHGPKSRFHWTHHYPLARADLLFDLCIGIGCWGYGRHAHSPETFEETPWRPLSPVASNRSSATFRFVYGARPRPTLAGRAVARASAGSRALAGCGKNRLTERFVGLQCEMLA